MEKIWLQNYRDDMPKVIDPDIHRSIIDMFEEYCKKFSFNTAFIHFGYTLSYDQLATYSEQFAANLQNDLHLKKGERLAIMLPNCLQFPIVLFGALRLGLVVVNVNPLYTERELLHQLKDSEAETIVILRNLVPNLAKVLTQTKIKHIIETEIGDLLPFFKRHLFNLVSRYKQKSKVPKLNSLKLRKVLAKGQLSSFTKVALIGEEPALLQYTGGTTGVLKGAVLTHRNIIANTLQCIAFVDGALEESKEMVVTPLPLYHIFSLTICCFVFLKLGAASLLITDPRNLRQLTKALKNNPFTVFVGVNTLYQSLLKFSAFRKLKFNNLKLSLAGGMAVMKEVAKDWQSLTGSHITMGYGLTEASPVVTINPLYEREFTGSIGIPVPSTDIEIRDEHNKVLGINEEGELCVKGPQVMKAYWHNKEETKLVLSKDGWLKTGDIVRMNEKGYIYLIDRKKDMILVSGFNVYPNEVEEVILSHPDVAEVSVVGAQDEYSGEVVKAVIVKKNPHLTENDILQYCRQNLAGYKIPKQIEFRPELPKNNVGKILRWKLRKENP